METATHLSPPAEKVCAVCEKADVKLNLCNQCVGIYYCSKACQIADWKIHKLLCKNFAETPRPESSTGNENFRRIIVLSDKIPRPEIAWVDASTEWVLGIFYPAIVPKGGCVRTTMLRFKPITPEGQSYDHHLQIIQRPAGKDGPFYNPPTSNSPIAASLRAAGLPIHYEWAATPTVMTRWTGKDKWAEVLIPGGPKLEDTTMADFSCALRWLSAFGSRASRLPGHLPGVEFPTTENALLDHIAQRRLSPTIWRRTATVLGQDADMIEEHEECSKRQLREFHASGRPETDCFPRHLVGM